MATPIAGPDCWLLSNRMPEIEARLRGISNTSREGIVAALLSVLEDGSRPLLERISAGNVLGVLGDPRLDPLHPPLCAVPAGPFQMGLEESEVEAVARRHGLPEAWVRKSTPRHTVDLDAFEIARYPVTEGEYRAFVHAVGYGAVPSHWSDGAPPPYRSNHPVHGLDWQDVLVYVEWVCEESGLQYRLPTEEEWEKAARGTDARIFPWGDRFEAGRCNTREGGVACTTPVGIYPDGASAYGVLDMAGNVEELTASLYWAYAGSKVEDPAYGTYRITRGGNYQLDADLARCDRRHGTAFFGAKGLRLARSAADGWVGRSRRSAP